LMGGAAALVAVAEIVRRVMIMTITMVETVEGGGRGDS
jgi:hypothetical protein